MSGDPEFPAQLEPATRLVDFAAILNYADVTNDYNPAHVDPVFAQQSPMRGIIAHGTLSLALIWQALRKTLGAAALDRVHLQIRFMRPVRIDDTVTGGGSLSSDPLPEGAQAVYDTWVRNARGEDVIVGTATLKPPRSSNP